MGQLGDLSPQGSIAIGVLVALISTSLQAVGLTLQRKSHILEDEKYPYDARRPAFKRRRWQVGMFMFVISNIVGSTIQITTLPLPVLSTLQASGLVFNTIFATLILGEPFTRYSFFGTILVCIGAILIATFGAIGEPAHTLDQLLELLVRPPFIRWMVGTAVIIGFTLAAARAVKLMAIPGRSRGWLSRCPVPHPSSSYHSPRIKTFRGVLYGSVSGILSAHSLLVAKSAVELLIRTIVDRVNQFNRWQSWIILLALVGLALTQLYYMHRGLKLCSTSILYPYVFCIYNIIAILDGLIYFHQTSRLSGMRAGLIAFGTIVLLSGVLCLSWRLEEIATHPGQVAVGAAPTTSLGPGLGLIEERNRSSSSSFPDFIDPGDEESHAERQPLLLHTPHQPPRRTPRGHHRTQTLPHISPIYGQAPKPGIETAEIWADLRDEDDDSKDGDLTSRSALILPPSPSSLRRHLNRHQRRSSTSSYPSSSQRRFPFWSGHRPNLSSPMNDEVATSKGKIRFPSAVGPSRRSLTWGAKRVPQSERFDWRRSSTPLVTGYGTDQSSTAQRDVSSNTVSEQPDTSNRPEIDDTHRTNGKEEPSSIQRVWDSSCQWAKSLIFKERNDEA
ncbi:hypothetical protein FQN57_003664 [Myotisia sp. PD_48]|nr:hypothetical protein FQN57_003664 [Myotisia sp. PD_48]